MKLNKLLTTFILFNLLFMLSACGSNSNNNPVSASTEQNLSDTRQEGETEEVLRMKIVNTNVSVEWEENESVKALKELCKNRSLTISLHMYGGFEQVGSIGSRLPSNDKQITTSSGDIVLYSSNQIVVFYGSNSWSYTKLGRITDKTDNELQELLGNGNVTITLFSGEQ